jgi:hypothetical protein
LDERSREQSAALKTAKDNYEKELETVHARVKALVQKKNLQVVSKHASDLHCILFARFAFDATHLLFVCLFGCALSSRNSKSSWIEPHTNSPKPKHTSNKPRNSSAHSKPCIYLSYETAFHACPLLLLTRHTPK